MKRDRVNYLAVGVFVLTVGVGFVALLFRLTGSGGPADHYHVYYDNVAGLKYGTGVYYEGYQVGQIESLTPERNGAKTHYRVDMSVQKGWGIPSDSVAAIVASGLLASVSINIKEGKSPTMLKPDSEIPGAGQVNLMAALNDVAADFRELSHDGIMPTLKNLNERIGALADEYRDLSQEHMRPLLDSVRKRVDDPELFDEMKTILKRVDDSAGRLQKLLGDQNQKRITNTLTNVENVSQNTLDLLNRIEITRMQMHHLVGELDQLATESHVDLGKAVKNAAESSDDLRAVMIDMRKTLRSVAENIDAIVYNMDGTARNMNEFSRQVRENPGLLLNGSPQQDQAGQAADKPAADAKAKDKAADQEKTP